MVSSRANTRSPILPNNDDFREVERLRADAEAKRANLRAEGKLDW